MALMEEIGANVTGLGRAMLDRHFVAFVMARD